MRCSRSRARRAIPTRRLLLFGYNPTGPFGTLPPGFQGSITVPFSPVTAGAGLASTFTLQTLQNPDAAVRLERRRRQ